MYRVRTVNHVLTKWLVVCSHRCLFICLQVQGNGPAKNIDQDTKIPALQGIEDGMTHGKLQLNSTFTIQKFLE